MIFLLGCFLHYQRGYYYTGLSSIHAEGADDAYISYRYGWNLANYNILSWNESGYRIVEGFTNPLWVYLSAGWSLLRNKVLVYPLMALTSVLISSLFLLLLLLAVVKTHNQSISGVIGLILLAAAPAIWLHATSGLESGVFGFGLALLAYLVIFPYRERRPPFGVLVLTVFLGLLRSDGFIYLAIILISALIAGSKSWRALAWGLLVSVVVIFSWRQLTFGEWLPNTAIAKVNFTLQDRLQVGSILLLLALLNSGLLVMLLLGISGLLLEVRRIFLAGLFIIIVWISYYLYIGGDIYFERHLVGLFTIAAAFSAPLWIKAKKLPRILMVLALTASIIISVQRDLGRFDYFNPKMNDPLVMLGKSIEKNRQDYGVLIAGAAGKIPFYAGGDCIDPFGLNDPYLATQKRFRFMPGHSAGSDLAAIEMALLHPSGVYATFSFLDTYIIPSLESISMWVNNRHPQDSVQHQVSKQQWDRALSSGDLFIWSIISKPVPVSTPRP